MPKESVTDNQKVKSAQKLKKIFSDVNSKAEMYCPIRDVMALASDKWSILIILYLGYFPILRFNALKKHVYGISNKILSERLKMLEADGYLFRRMYAEVPIRVEYGLTDFGHSYLQKLLELTEWATLHGDAVIENRKNYNSAVHM